MPSAEPIILGAENLLPPTGMAGAYTIVAIVDVRRVYDHEDYITGIVPSLESEDLIRIPVCDILIT